MEAFTGGPVEMEATKGGRFSLFGGNVTGEFTELVSATFAKKTNYRQTWLLSSLKLYVQNLAVLTNNACLFCR